MRRPISQNIQIILMIAMRMMKTMKEGLIYYQNIRGQTNSQPYPLNTKNQRHILLIIIKSVRKYVSIVCKPVKINKW